MTHKHAVFSITLFLAICCAGCFSAPGKSASSGRGPAGEADEEKRSGDGAAADDEEGLTPEMSMRRDLDRLRAREDRQARSLAEMRNELSESESHVIREEKLLAETRSRIARYEEALGGRAPATAHSAFVLQDGYGSGGAEDLPGEFAHLFNRDQTANLALGDDPAPKTYAIRTPIRYEERRPGAAAGEQRAALREPGQFAGAPRGYARPGLPARLPEPEGEVVVWDPNDPSQAIPPEAALGMSAPAPATARASGKSAAVTTTAGRERGVGENSFGAYAAEVFSPDLYLGRGS